jgi:hypothetical protein
MRARAFADTDELTLAITSMQNAQKQWQISVYYLA